MKKIFLFAALGLIMLASSCKKTSSGDITTTNTISAKINGTQATYSSQPYAETELDGSNPLDYYFYAYTYDSTSNNNYMYVDLDSYYGPFTARTYGVAGDSTSDAYFEVDSASNWYGSRSSGIIKVTSFGSTIQGTFSGKLYQSNNASGDSITITDGKFNISY
ncbi:MAG TPA: hypothetical protein VK718_10490 [Ferruginibacter sp.]|jgi:hypothetical protein|nr:hypothetical protein [Ferruginibacter sp.]